LYDHHQSQIILVGALFSQLSDRIVGVTKRRLYIRQVRAIRIILDPILSVYCKEISRHPTSNATLRLRLPTMPMKTDRKVSFVDPDQIRPGRREAAVNAGPGGRLATTTE